MLEKSCSWYKKTVNKYFQNERQGYRGINVKVISVRTCKQILRWASLLIML